MPWTWTLLTHQSTFGIGTMLLLTDSTVCQISSTNPWWRLRPYISAKYINGAWSSFSSGPNAPLHLASAMLQYGRVFVAAGGDNAGAPVDLLAAEIHDPVAKMVCCDML
jgi:hypothetical protein